MPTVNIAKINKLVRNHHFLDNFVVGLLTIIVRLRGIIVVPLIIKQLGIVEFGIWSQCMAISALLSTVLMFNLHTYIVRSIPEEQQKSEQDDIYISGIYLLLSAISIFAVVSIIAFGIVDFGALLLQDSSLTSYLWLSIIGAAFMALFSFNMNYYRAIGKIQFQAVANAVVSTIELLGISAAIYLYGIFEALIFIVILRATMWVISTIAIGARAARLLPRWSLMKEGTKFSAPLIFSNISTVLVKNTDRILIGSYFGMESLGLYSIAVSLGNFALVLLTPFSVTLLPKMSKIWKENRQNAIDLVSAYQRIFILLSVPGIVFVGFFGLGIIKMFSNSDSAQPVTHMLLFVVLVSNIFWGMTVFTTFCLFGEKRTGAVSGIRIIGSILTVVGILIVFQFLDYWSAGFIILSANILIYALNLWWMTTIPEVKFSEILIAVGTAILLCLGLRFGGLDNATSFSLVLVFLAYYLSCLLIVFAIMQRWNNDLIRKVTG